MDPSAQTAISPSDNILATDNIGEGQDAVRYQLGVLDDIGCVAHHAGNENLARRQLDVPPDFVFVFVAHVAGFDQVRLRVNTEHNVDDVAQRKIGGVWPMPATPANVITHAIHRDAFEGVIQNFHPL